MNRETFERKQLFAGEVFFITPIAVAAGEFKAGDLMVTTDGITWAKATAETAKIANYFAVCAEDKTLEGKGEVIAYKEGYFSKAAVKVGGAEASEAVIEMLKTKNIFIKVLG